MLLFNSERTWETWMGQQKPLGSQQACNVLHLEWIPLTGAGLDLPKWAAVLLKGMQGLWWKPDLIWVKYELLVYVTYNEMVRGLGMFNLADRRLRHDQVAPYTYLKDSYKKYRAKLSRGRQYYTGKKQLHCLLGSSGEAFSSEGCWNSRANCSGRCYLPDNLHPWRFSGHS